MTPVLQLFDALLVLILLWLAWSLLRSEDLFRAVILFIVFGLFMVIAWVRLDAPDIALAEAAIGAGLTGVLLLDAVRHGETEKKESRTHAPVPERKRLGKHSLIHAPLFLLLATAGGVLIQAITDLPGNPEGLSAVVDAHMSSSGVNSRVTAVLLNFRGYDTLLEIGVMLIAVTGVLSLRGYGTVWNHPARPHDTLLAAFTRLLVPVALLVAAYLLYEGAYAPGGAFQGGSVLGASLVLLRLSDFPPPPWLRGKTTDTLLFAGFALFLLIAGGVLFTGNNLLEYPADYAGGLIFLIEAVLTVSIGFILAELFSPWRRP
ncbi:MAG: DUF4040 domain-containing protein [Alphaproteobacteria bacterium]|uniref:DUF4040 domain-containing protein n=1 Tax=Candidatus Nitrobium versatile TaxID=2884831 RepID=A0A953JAD0_9BACT|nr:DUF4040 domain-containing protein [Candidatus Nitrobium versatile]